MEAFVAGGRGHAGLWRNRDGIGRHQKRIRSGDRSACMPHSLWVGTYAEKGGAGLQPVDPSGKLGAAEQRIANASWGLWSAPTGTAYFVDEQETGRVTAWSPGPKGWEPRGASASGGSLPCYLALSPTGDRLAVANYEDGAVALIAIDKETGELGGIVDVTRPSGSGPDPERQEGPHAHCVVFDEVGERLFHVDLGLDRVFAYPINDGRLGPPEVAFEAPPGSGPRHLLLHPDGHHALLLAELGSKLMLLERRRAGFSLVHAIPTLPEPQPGNLGGHLALGPEARVLVTNRGHDSLAAFRLVDGRLEADGWTPTGGSSPRHFVMAGGRALVAHEKSGSIAFVDLPAAGASSAAPEQIPAPGAAFIFEVPDLETTG
jgi:6-phosphogluconolactonase